MVSVSFWFYVAKTKSVNILKPVLFFSNEYNYIII